MKSEGNGNDSILLHQKALLSPIEELDELDGLERHTSLDRDGKSSCAKSPGLSPIPPFQDPWYPTTIASLGICPK